MSFMMDSLECWTELATWLNAEIRKRKLTGRSLAKDAGISNAVIARMRNAQGPFDVRSLNAVADALQVPREEVQQKAGLLAPMGDVPPRLQAVMRRAVALPDAVLNGVIEVFETTVAFAERQARGQ